MEFLALQHGGAASSGLPRPRWECFIRLTLQIRPKCDFFVSFCFFSAVAVDEKLSQVE